MLYSDENDDYIASNKEANDRPVSCAVCQNNAPLVNTLTRPRQSREDRVPVNEEAEGNILWTESNIVDGINKTGRQQRSIKNGNPNFRYPSH